VNRFYWAAACVAMSELAPRGLPELTFLL
jgi:hypothetical protein